MVKITFIGAGSLVFGENVLTDILTFPTLVKDAVICLEDIDPNRLDLMYQFLQKTKEDNLQVLEGVTIEKTTNQRKAIENAKYIINAIQVGGLEAMKYDMDIPLKYGVSQSVGDTLGPGGVFRFLRTVPVLDSILKDIQEVGYNAGNDGDKPLFLNYTNPMAMNTWYCNAISPDSTVGLCHGVHDTSAGLSFAMGIKYNDLSFFCAGINHMAWFLELRYKDPNDLNATWQDAYPLLEKTLEGNPRIVDLEKVRVDMMRATGYFMTESSAHFSEYIPYYRKRTDLLEKYRGDSDFFFSSLKHGAYYDHCIETEKSMEQNFKRKLRRKNIRLKQKPTTEYAAHIINAIETNIPFGFNGNVINKEGGIITNLPEGCCVEVPVFADSQGLHPQGGIELPTICQALCMSNIMVQKAAVEGALNLDKNMIYHAVLLDPNTASVCSPEEIREIVDQMFEVEKKWLPQFNQLRN
jgi:alpha-galactosidase